MALIKCPECGKEISDTVDACVHCGYKIEKKEHKEKDKGKVIVHGHPEWYINNPKIKICDKDDVLDEIERNGIWEHDFDKDTTLIFRYMGKVAEVSVKAHEAKEIFLSIDRLTGSLIATSDDNDFSQSESIVQTYDKEEYLASANNASPTSKKMSVGLVVFGTIAIIWFISLVIYATTPMSEDKACSVIKSYVKEQMKDPSSAEFEDDCRVTEDSSDSNLWYVKGSVRGKNSLGGVTVQKYTVLMAVDGNKYEVKSVYFNW